MGRLNTFGLFIDRSLTRLLATRGFLGFIVPNTLLTQEHYQSLREQILRYRLDSLTTYQYPVFINAVVETTVLTIQKTPPGANRVRILECNNRELAYQSRDIEQAAFHATHCKAFLVRVDASALRLKDALDSIGVPLDTIARINQAIALKHDRSKSLFRERKGSRYKPVLDGRNIQRYRLDWDGTYLAYDIRNIHSCKRTDIFEAHEKLLFRRVGERLIATYDDAQYYALNTLVVITVRPHVELSLKYILGLLNSRLLNFYYLSYLKSTKRVFSEIQARQIAQLPIRQPDLVSTDGARQHDAIVRLVENMLVLQKEGRSARTAHEKGLLEREIDATDRRIDLAVYDLYELGKGEIAMVEGDAL